LALALAANVSPAAETRSVVRGWTSSINSATRCRRWLENSSTLRLRWN